MQPKQVELPSVEELKEWIETTYRHLNPDVKPFFLMGIQALYIKLGGEKFIEYK